VDRSVVKGEPLVPEEVDAAHGIRRRLGERGGFGILLTFFAGKTDSTTMVRLLDTGPDWASSALIASSWFSCLTPLPPTLQQYQPGYVSVASFSAFQCPSHRRSSGNAAYICSR
jgi:hypothetical protein